MQGLSLAGEMLQCGCTAGGMVVVIGKCHGCVSAIESMCIWVVSMLGKYSSYVDYEPKQPRDGRRWSVIFLTYAIPCVLSYKTHPSDYSDIDCFCTCLKIAWYNLAVSQGVIVVWLRL